MKLQEILQRLEESGTNDYRDISSETKSLYDFQVNAYAGQKFKYRKGVVVKFKDENDEFYCAYVTQKKVELL